MHTKSLVKCVTMGFYFFWSSIPISIHLLFCEIFHSIVAWINVSWFSHEVEEVCTKMIIRFQKVFNLIVHKCVCGKYNEKRKWAIKVGLYFCSSTNTFYFYVSGFSSHYMRNCVPGEKPVFPHDILREKFIIPIYQDS